MAPTPQGPPLTESERLDRELKARQRAEQKQIEDNAKAHEVQAMAALAERAQPTEIGEPVEIDTLSIKKENPARVGGKIITFLRASEGYEMHVMTNRTIQVKKAGAREIVFIPFGNIAQYTLKFSA